MGKGPGRWPCSTLRALTVPRAQTLPTTRERRWPKPSAVPLCLQPWLSQPHTQGLVQLPRLREHSGHVCGMGTFQPLRWLGDLFLWVAIRRSSQPAAFPGSLCIPRTDGSEPTWVSTAPQHRLCQRVQMADLSAASGAQINHRTLEAFRPLRGDAGGR